MQNRTLDRQTVTWLVSTLVQFNISTEASRDQQFFFVWGGMHSKFFNAWNNFFFLGSLNKTRLIKKEYDYTVESARYV